MAGNVRYCSTLLLSAIRHLRPPHFYSLNRSYTKRTGAVNVSHSAPDSYNQGHLNAVSWTATKNAHCLLACRNFDFMKTHASGCTLDTVHFTSMATGHSWFSVVEELGSLAFCKIAAPVSLRRCLELPDLPDNPLSSYISGKINCPDSIFIWCSCRLQFPITDLKTSCLPISALQSLTIIFVSCNGILWYSWLSLL